MRPLDQTGPHPPDQDQGRVAEVADLEELPDHRHLEHGADAAGRHQKRIGDQHELVEPREEGPVLEGHADERVDLLLEWQIDADPDGPNAFR
jgi:hypothetical protein